MQTAILKKTGSNIAADTEDGEEDQAYRLSDEESAEDVAEETASDGTGGVVQKTTANAHEFQGTLQAFEDRVAGEGICHGEEKLHYEWRRTPLIVVGMGDVLKF